MQASLGKIEDPDMDEDELETRLLTVETAVKGVGKTAKGEFKCNTRVQRNNHPTPEDWSYPTDWKKQDCHYYCIQSQEEEEEDDDLDKAQKTTKRGGSYFLDVFFHYLTTHYKILN